MVTVESLFIKASREKWRFESTKGQLPVEDLWDLPLESEKRASLNAVALTVYNELKATTEMSFVSEGNVGNQLLQEKLELVKHIIAVRKLENFNRTESLRKKAEIARLEQKLDERRLSAEDALPTEELEKMLAALKS